MHKISFNHPVTKKDIGYSTDKDFIIIYGKNGVGKTTLSKTYEPDGSFVFNEEYINKNVYSTGFGGTSITADNRREFSELWIGDEIVKLVKERELIEIDKKKIKDELKKINDRLKLELSKYDIKLNILTEMYIDANFDFKLETWETDFDDYVEDNKLQTNIDDDNKLSKEQLVVQNNLVLTGFTDLLNSSLMLKELVLKANESYLQELNKEIIKISKYSEYFKKLEKALSGHNDQELAQELIQEMYYYHVKHNKNNCIFCDNKITSSRQDLLRMFFEDEKRELKNVILNSIYRERTIINNAIDNESYNRIFKNIIEYFNDVDNKLEKFEENISNNILIKSI